MIGLKITDDTTGTFTFLPEDNVLSLDVSAAGLLTGYVYRDNTGAVVAVTSIPAYVKGTNSKYEFGDLSPSGYMQAPIRNYP